MISFIVKVKFSNGGTHEAEFLADAWPDAMPQAAEIVEAVAGNVAAGAGTVTKVTVERLD